ncbi:MAG: methylated-DNA--[protein]-cysteine S-methyltransferase [Demequinaceae bacterium]|nr:methylated-DNA--[protein]-cysteine S-methyltransferase [Demequinaceae bacterium]
MQRVWLAMRGIPAGEVVTYGELAVLAGNPRAARAAGHACARNVVGIFVPCHRVVSTTGLGGYGLGGNDLKRRLLQYEGVDVDRLGLG